MKIAYKALNSVIDLDEHPIFTLTVESPLLFFHLLHDIKQQLAGFDGDVILSEKDKELSIQKKMELITDPVDFDINTTSLLNKVAARVNSIAMDETHFEQSQKILANFEKFLYDILLDMDADFYCDKLSMLAIIKASGIKAEVCQNSLLELLYSYMKLVREFDTDKLFVFVNLRSFVTMEELQSFFHTVKSHDFQVLLLENREYPLLEDETKLIIDKDLCEI